MAAHDGRARSSLSSRHMSRKQPKPRLALTMIRSNSPTSGPSILPTRSWSRPKHPRMASVVRAWCRKKDQERPALMDLANPQPLVRALEEAGQFDFERLTAECLPSLCGKVGAWPDGMAQTLLLEEL